MGTQRFPLNTNPGLQKQPVIQEPVQLVDGSLQLGMQAGPHSMYSASGGHFTVSGQETCLEHGCIAGYSVATNVKSFYLVLLLAM